MPCHGKSRFSSHFRKGQELAWLCPSVLLYLASICPPIWILELKMANIRSFRTNWKNVSPEIDAFWDLRSIAFDQELTAGLVTLHYKPVCTMHHAPTSRRERLCLYYQLVQDEMAHLGEQGSSQKVALLLELMQVTVVT